MPWLIGEFWGLFLAQLLGVIYRPISIMGWDRLIFHGSCMDQNHPKPWYMQFISKWLVQMDWMFVLRAINAIILAHPIRFSTGSSAKIDMLTHP